MHLFGSAVQVPDATGLQSPRIGFVVPVYVQGPKFTPLTVQSGEVQDIGQRVIGVRMPHALPHKR